MEDGMKNLISRILSSSLLMALILTSFLTLAGCQTGKSLSDEGMAGQSEQKAITSEQGVGPEGQLPGQESFGQEPQMRPEGEGGWENPNQ